MMYHLRGGEEVGGREETRGRGERGEGGSRRRSERGGEKEGEERMD